MFADGRPGVGLMVLRAAATCAALINLAMNTQLEHPSSWALPFLIAIDSIILLLGIWTSVTALLFAAANLFYAVVQHDASPQLLLAAIGVALFLTGPGAFSLDARLHGWKRIKIGD
jgi:putative oxidoreductase